MLSRKNEVLIEIQPTTPNRDWKLETEINPQRQRNNIEASSFA
jgi:hypothetical protein